MEITTVLPRFAGTTLVNADVLRFPREALVLRGLSGYKGLKGDVLVFETGQELADQRSVLSQAYNRRVRRADSAIGWEVDKIADRYYGGNRHKISYKTGQVFPKALRKLLQVGVVEYFGWNKLGRLTEPTDPRFSGTTFVNREVVTQLQKALGLTPTQVPSELAVLRGYDEPLKEKDMTVDIESGQSHGWWSALWDRSKRAQNRRIRLQDKHAKAWAQTLADRYAAGKWDTVAYQTPRIFTTSDRYLIGIGLSVTRGWNGLTAAT